MELRESDPQWFREMAIMYEIEKIAYERESEDGCKEIHLREDKQEPQAGAETSAEVVD